MAVPTYSNLVDLYATSVERFADNPLLGARDDASETWNWLTFREFGALIDQCRAGLSGLGVTKGDRVAAISDNRAEWAIGAYATYGLAAAWVPMYEAQLPKDWKYILNDSGAKVLIAANEGIAAKVAEFKDEIPTLETIVTIDVQGGGDFMTWDDLLATGSKDPVDTVSPEEKDTAGLIYTSGTTGNPKGVILSHGNLSSNVNGVNVVFPLETDDRSASFLPWAHSFGQTIELHTLVAMGASTGLTSAKTLMRDLPEIRPTILVAVPTVFNKVYDGLLKRMAATGGFKKSIFDSALANSRKREQMAKQGQTTRWVEIKHSLYDRLVFQKVRDGFGGRLKYAFSGGAAISDEVAEFISALGITVYEGYGLTETSPVVTANTREARRLGTVGKPIPEVSVTIDGDATDEEGLGEIVVHGPNVMQGYYNLAEENAKVFTDDGGFRTGDLGSVDSDGYLMIRGRIKEQYKLENGKYVVPSPIEEQLTLSGYIASAMVYGEQRPYNVAVLVPDVEALNGWAAEQGFDTSDTKVLLGRDEVHAMYESEVEKYSGPVKRYERVKGFVLEPEEWTPENGFLTPSLKVKRRAVMQAYGDDIAALYQ